MGIFLTITKWIKLCKQQIGNIQPTLNTTLFPLKKVKNTTNQGRLVPTVLRVHT